MFECVTVPPVKHTLPLLKSRRCLGLFFFFFYALKILLITSGARWGRGKVELTLDEMGCDMLAFSGVAAVPALAPAGAAAAAGKGQQ